jgi:hypothetical protein
MTNEERDNILDQHKEIYDGYVTSYAQPAKEQPLYTQDFANDKQGLTVSNKGVVTGYKNMNINEMRHDGKDIGLFSSEAKENYISPGSQYDTTETFESDSRFEVVTDFEDDDDNFMVSVGAHRDMIGDGNHDLDHGTFEDDDSDMVLVSPEAYDDQDYYESEDDRLDFDFDDVRLDDEEIDDEEVEGLFDDLKESLDMFKRFTKYN